MQYDLAVELFAGLLLICCAVAIAVKLVRLPYTIALVLSGLAIAIIPRMVGVTFPLEGAVLTSDPVFYLILPPLLFQGALNMQLDALRRNYRVILLLAIPGVLISITLLVVVSLLTPPSPEEKWAPFFMAPGADQKQ